MKSLFAEKEPREKRSFRSRLDAKREKRKRSLEKEREERTEERENAFLFGTEDGEEEEWSLFGRSKESGLKPFDLFASDESPDEPSYCPPEPHLQPTPPCDDGTMEEEAVDWSIGSLFDEGEEVEEEEDVYIPVKKPTTETSSMTHTSRVATTTTSASISITTTTIASTVSQPIAGGNSEEVALRKKVAELERLLSEKEKKISWYVFKHQYL